MAKAEKPTKRKEDTASDEAPKPKRNNTRKLLMAAFAMCLASVGAGIFLARMAYLNDAESYEPEYVEDEAAPAKSAGKDAMTSKAPAKEIKIKDPLAKDGHPAGDAMALNRKDSKDSKEEGGSKDGELVDNGLLEFGDFLTNIVSVDAQGMQTKAFLKMSLIVVYRTDPGAAAVMQEQKPFMRDIFNAYLRSLNETDVRGMAGVLNVKAQLLKRARAAVGSDLPEEILISDLIVQ